MGLAEGQTVKTDCSVNWTAPDGKVYCFSSEKSKETFLKNAEANIKKAQDFVSAKASAAATGKTKNFTEEDVNAAVKKVIDERTKDGAFVFRDPKLNADLHLVFDEIKIVRGMEGYGWFPNVIFHDKDEPKKKYAIDFWFKPEGQDLKLMDIRVRGGAEAGGRQLGHDHPLAAGLVVATGRRAPWRHGGDPRLAGDERHPRLHRHP